MGGNGTRRMAGEPNGGAGDGSSGVRLSGFHWKKKALSEDKGFYLKEVIAEPCGEQLWGERVKIDE